MQKKVIRITLKCATLERKKSKSVNSAAGLEVAAIGTTAFREERAMLRQLKMVARKSIY